jgi:hypothetical protein
MSTLYITTFNEELYQKSGKYLLNSFYQHQPKDHILVAYEDFLFSTQTVNEHCFNLHSEQYPLLADWTQANSDIVDIAYGGGKEYDRKDKQTSWNRQAARWFRKIVALHFAIHRYGNDTSCNFENFVFLDCDCEILKPIPESLISGLLSKHDAFYHYGKHRYATDTGVESGVIGFTKRSYLLNECFNMYLGGRFRKERRWDDGFIFSRIIKGYPNCGIDVIADVFAPDGECVKYGPFAEYIRHDKGKHTRT